MAGSAKRTIVSDCGAKMRPEARRSGSPTYPQGDGMSAASLRRSPLLGLGLLTAAAVAIHGYHLGAEDAEIYVPAAKHMLHPELYPYAREFFLSHEQLSLFSSILASTARLTHLSMDWTIFVWYFASIFAMLLCCWVFVSVCFESVRARWCALLVITAVLTMPATNTGLPLMDPYLTARSFSTPLTLLALSFLLTGGYLRALFLVLMTAAIHPQMAVYLSLLAVIVWVMDKIPVASRQQKTAIFASFGFLPVGFQLGPAGEPYREALYARDFYFLSNWTWYHWLGMLAPLAILAWFWKRRPHGTTPAFQRISGALIPFGMISILIAATFTTSHTMDMYARLQPLRCFHLITLVFVLLLGGVLGEYAGKNKMWMLPALFLVLSGGMFLVARQTYPHSSHIDWPWMKTSPNAWVNTLLWVRGNTPTDAVFAVDSRYFKDDGVDEQGFRAISERSDLADYYKDSGVVAIFPNLAPEWKRMSDATYGLNQFGSADFERLAKKYPVTWAVIHGPAPSGMACPYQQRGYAVCEIPHTSIESN